MQPPSAPQTDPGDQDTDFDVSPTRESDSKPGSSNSVRNNPISVSFRKVKDTCFPATPQANPEAEAQLYHLHVRLGHLPFAQIQQGARDGIFPRYLANCRVPKCPGCLFAKAKRKQWRFKGPYGHIGNKATQPGDCVSVDQLECKTPGLVAQTNGKLTKKRHYFATVFVDQVSGLDFVHTHETANAEDAVTAKEAFESFCAQHGVTPKHYHCDNGIFTAQAWRDAVKRANQTMTFCGVNAHHQNGVAERRILDLSDKARAMLIDARHRNPHVTDNLWPFALRQASAIGRTLPRIGRDKSPLELFSGVDVRPSHRHFHPFGCPAFVLNNDLQSGKSQPRWDSRARVGCYLGHSPEHATSVAIILHPSTGLVSPQFHCVFDDHFETVDNLGAFAKLWSGNKPSKKDYRRTNVSQKLQQPWFLQSDDDDSSSESESDDDSLESSDPGDASVASSTSDSDDISVDEGAMTSKNVKFIDEVERKRRKPETSPKSSPPASANEGAPAPVLRKTRSGRTVKPTRKVLDRDAARS